MTPSSVLLFAAGLGTRMAPLTNHTPKPMIEVAGRPLIDHALDHCDGLRVVVNVHYKADQIRSHLSGTDIAISDETDGLLETGGGLLRAQPLLRSNPVFTMNTDAVWARPTALRTLADNWDATKMDALLLLVPLERAVGHRGTGDFAIAHDGHLTKGNKAVYTGAQIIKTDLLRDIQEEPFSIWRLWSRMLEDRRMFGTLYDGSWCDVGQPRSIPLAEAMIEGLQDV